MTISTLMKLYELSVFLWKILSFFDSPSVRFAISEWMHSDTSFAYCITRCKEMIAILSKNIIRIQFCIFKNIHLFKIPKQVPFTSNAHIARMLLPRKITHLLVRFEKHMVDSEHRLHFVPSMIKFHSPVKQRKRENEMSTHNQRRSKKKWQSS